MRGPTSTTLWDSTSSRSFYVRDGLGRLIYAEVSRLEDGTNIMVEVIA